MKNLNTLISGMTGSGKTSFARHMLALAPRAFVFDPVDDYDGGAVFYDTDAALDFYDRNAKNDFHLIYRGERETFPMWLDILFQSQRHMNLPPLAVFMEESSYYSTSHTMGKYLEDIYTKGRRQRISVVTLVQRDTQVNPIIRSNSQVWVAMMQRKFSTDMKQEFTSEDLERIQSLETFTPVSGAPIEGKHYLLDRPGFPFWDAWKGVVS